MIPFTNPILFNSAEYCDPRPLVGGAALSFNDSLQTYVISSNVPTSKIPDGNITFVVRARYTDTSNRVQICLSSSLLPYNTNRSGEIPYQIDIQGNKTIKFRTEHAQNNFYNHFSNASLIAGQWYNIVVTLSKNGNDYTSEIFINGVSDSINTYSTSARLQQYGSTPAYTLLGGIFRNNSYANNFGLTGNLYGVTVYNEVLNQSQITGFENDILPNVPTYFFYKVDSSFGTTAYDSSGNDNQGTINSATWIATNEFSFRDHLGFNQIGVIFIPRDESNINFDVIGNELQNKGKACDIA